MRKMSAVTALLLCLLMLGAVLEAGERRVYGRVVDGDGRGQAGCRLEFRQGEAENERLVYSATTDRYGKFYVTEPRSGRYEVIVRRGRDYASFTVHVDGKGFSPSTLVVYW